MRSPEGTQLCWKSQALALCARQFLVVLQGHLHWGTMMEALSWCGAIGS